MQIGENVVINVFADVNIDDYVVTADRVSIISNTHNYENVDMPINLQGGEGKDIYIGAGSWIGINATILAGTKIGKNCVVGANSVVKGEFPDFCVIAGCPGKIVKRYDARLNKYIRTCENDPKS